MERDDIPNMSLARSKELMLEYQKTRDPEIFGMLLAKFDKYLIQLVYKFSKCYKTMQSESLQELYHTAILGFHKAVLGMKEKHRPEYMFLFFTAFVKYELRMAYEYKLKELPYEAEVFEVYNNTSPEELRDSVDANLVKALLESDALTETDRRLVVLRFNEGKSYPEIGKILGMTRANAWRKVQRLKLRIARLFDKEA